MLLMKGNMKAWTLLAICWTTLIAPAWVHPVEEKETLRFKMVKFSTTTGGQSYIKLVETLQKELASKDKRHGIPVMRDPSTISAAQRYLLIQLSNHQNDSITLAIDVSSAYLLAFQAGDQSYFFADTSESAYAVIFPKTQKNRIPYCGTYKELERAADELVQDVNLGMLELDQAISLLGRTSNITQKNQAHSLIVCIQVVIEATKFKYIEYLVYRSIVTQQSFLPDAAMLSLVDNWVALSSAIQQSNQGVFASRIRLRRSNKSSYYVDSVTGIIISNLAQMLFVCKGQASDLSPLIIRSVVDNDLGTCNVPEPTTRIVGPNNLCADVFLQFSWITQLYPCKSNADANQLWTFKRDKTIQSNGRCLTTSGFNAGSYVSMKDCKTADTNATRWELTNDGTIKSSAASLVLSVEDANSGSRLIVKSSIHSINQGWLATNVTASFLTSIGSALGQRNLCLEAKGQGIWVTECVQNKTKQKWAVYADGSIRPEHDQDNCITSKDNKQKSQIVIHPCRYGLSTQHWMFQNDGSIKNLNNGFVIDIESSDPSLESIILWPFHGNNNQLWLPLL